VKTRRLFPVLFRPLPWEYAVRNLFRRPLRTALTLAALTAVVVLVLVVVGFIQGLEATLAASGDPHVALLSNLGSGDNLEYSSIPARTPDLVAASVPGIRQRHAAKHLSPELYLGTRVAVEDGEPQLGVVRGVTPSALLVRSLVQIEQGDWPGPGEVLVGRLVATKLAVAGGPLRLGQRLRYEGRTWRISGTFSAAGSVFESEVWCRLDELQQATKRQDLSLVAVQLAPDGDFADLSLFCNQRLDLELQAMRELDYYAALQQDYQPIRLLAWLLVMLLCSAGVFAGMNTMYGSVLGRIPELAMLQTVGFSRRAIVLSLIQEGLVLAAAASQLAALLALIVFDGRGVRFTMGAFPLRIDGGALLIGCVAGLALGLLGAVPPSIRALRMPVVDALKAV
jgi:putative ABC transport system permease protein